jgi:lysozyme
MKCSINGISLIAKFEGIRLQIYRDCVGKRTIGIGHLILEHESFEDGITETQAMQLLYKDLAPVEAYLSNWAINQNQYDALADFAYNLGIGSLKQLLSHGIENVPTQIIEWDRAGGNVIAGLSKRRQAELDLFRTK